jgi:hypothetical protein
VPGRRQKTTRLGTFLTSLVSQRTSRPKSRAGGSMMAFSEQALSTAKVKAERGVASVQILVRFLFILAAFGLAVFVRFVPEKQVRHMRACRDTLNLWGNGHSGSREERVGPVWGTTCNRRGNEVIGGVGWGGGVGGRAGGGRHTRPAP